MSKNGIYRVEPHLDIRYDTYDISDTYDTYGTYAHIVPIFNSPSRSLWLSFEQKLSILPAPGVIIQERQNLTFDLTMTRELRLILKS